MRRVLIIGIGAGDPDFLTIQAIDALNQADVFFIPDKGTEKAALRKLRTDICARFIKDRQYRFVEVATPPRDRDPTDYHAAVTDWHARIEAQYRALLSEELSEGECGAFLVWGDPTLYDSTLRIIQSLAAKGLVLEYIVIPGISSVQALAAKHRVPLNSIGEPVTLTTGRRLGQTLPDDAGSVVVLLDGEQAFNRLATKDVDIYWGAYLGTDDEILIAGKLADVAETITATRADARKTHGWIMDTYLLRRPASR